MPYTHICASQCTAGQEWAPAQAHNSHNIRQPQGERSAKFQSRRTGHPSPSQQGSLGLINSWRQLQQQPETSCDTLIPMQLQPGVHLLPAKHSFSRVKKKPNKTKTKALGPKLLFFCCLYGMKTHGSMTRAPGDSATPVMSNRIIKAQTGNMHFPSLL